MIDFTAIMSVTKINPTTELALFLGRVTILGFIYIYGRERLATALPVADLRVSRVSSC